MFHLLIGTLSLKMIYQFSLPLVYFPQPLTLRKAIIKRVHFCCLDGFKNEISLLLFYLKKMLFLKIVFIFFTEDKTEPRKIICFPQENTQF